MAKRTSTEKKEQTEKAKQAEKNPYSVFAEKDDEEVCMFVCLFVCLVLNDASTLVGH